MKPVLKDFSFKELSQNPTTANHGTVTGPNLDHHLVVVTGKNKRWVGTVTGASGTADVWNVVVKRFRCKDEPEKDRGPEDVAVTVTNPPTNEESDEVAKQVEIVP